MRTLLSGKTLKRTHTNVLWRTDNVLEYIIDGYYVRIEKKTYDISIKTTQLTDNGIDDRYLPMKVRLQWRDENIYYQEIFHDFLSTFTIEDFIRMGYANQYEFCILYTQGDMSCQGDEPKDEIVDSCGDYHIKEWTWLHNDDGTKVLVLRIDMNEFD